MDTANTKQVPNVANNNRLVNSSPSILFKVKKTVLEMLHTRGYDISREKGLLKESFTVDRFVSVYKSYAESQRVRGVNMSFKRALDGIYFKDSPKQKNTPTAQQTSPILVYFSETPMKNTQIGLPIVNQVLSRANEYEKTGVSKAPIKHIIIIAEKKATPAALNEMRKLPAYRFEFFIYEKITRNPLRHSFTPPQRILRPNERDELIRKNPTLDIDDLPTMAYNDPISRFLGALSGDVIEIIRKNGSDSLVEKSLAYRLVTDKVGIP